MAQLFIPQAPDLLGPAFNIERLRQSRQGLEQQIQTQKTLEQYRQDQIREKKIETWLKLSQRDPEAAKQFRDADPELSRLLPENVRESPVNQIMRNFGLLPPRQQQQPQAAPAPRESVEFAGPIAESNITDQTPLPQVAQATPAAPSAPAGLPAGTKFVPDFRFDESGNPSMSLRSVQPGAQVENLMAQIEGAGIPSTDPRFKEFVSRYGRAMAYTGVGQNLVLDKINQELEAYAQQLQKGRQAPQPTAQAPVSPPQTKSPVAGTAAPSGIGGGASIGGVAGDVIRYETELTARRSAAEAAAKRLHGELPVGIQTKMDSYKSTENAHETVRALYKPEYVGKGFAQFIEASQSEFQKQANTARQGKYQGGALQGALAGKIAEFFGFIPEEQVAFYRAILDVQDQLLRARSGAQINEREFARLAGIAYKATDEPKVFEGAYRRFGQQLNFDITQVLEGATKSPKEMLEERRRRVPPPPLGFTQPVK